MTATPRRAGRDGIALRRLAVLAALAGAPGAPADLSADLRRVQAAEAARVEMLERAAAAVVCVFSDADEPAGGGSGALIHPEGYALTCFHVVEEMLDTRRGTGGLRGGQRYPLTILGIDPAGDIALVRLAGAGSFDAFVLADEPPCVGEPVAALGNPFLLAEDYAPTVTLGIVSGLHRYQYGQGNLLEYADCIQVSTSINPGNSGGPLVDMQGRLAGINGRASFEERGRVNVGVGYAVPAGHIRRFLPALRAGRLCTHGTLGATVRQTSAGLVFDAVQIGSAAHRAGIAPGERVISVGGRAVRTANEFNNAVVVYPADWPVEVVWESQGQVRRAVVRLDPLPLPLRRPWVPDAQENRREALRTLEAWLARTFGAQRPATLRLRARAADSRETFELRFADGTLRAVSAAGAEAPAPLHAELVQVLRPLMPDAGGPQARLRLLGGDERDGRVVAVVEADGTVRAFIEDLFEPQPGALHAVEQLDAQGRTRAVWVPEPAAPGVWPRVWQRRAPDGTVQRVTLEPVAEAAE